MPEKLSFKHTLTVRKSHFAKSCKLHYEAAPLKVVRGSRQHVYDDVGNEYLDCVNLIAHVGHCHPHVVDAGQKQMARLNTCQGFLTEQLSMYAKRLVATMPDRLCVAFFVNSGSEAVDLAMRLARAYTKHEDFIVVDNSYHGNLGNVIDISPRGLYKMGERPKKHVHVVATPDSYRGKYREDEDNLGFKYACEVQQAIQAARADNRSIAAFVSEIQLTLCGIVNPPRDYYKHTYSYVREAGGVCIADEIQSGMGRTGLYWGFQHYDVEPDIVTVGKPMGNGHPMAAVVTTREIANTLHEFGSGCGGNPVSCAIGLAVLEVIENEKLLSSARCVGRYLVDGFRAIQDKHPMMGDVRGEGLLAGVEIVTCKQSRKPAREAAELLCYKLKQAKILVANDGPDKNVLYITPPMCFTTADAKHVIEHVDKLLLEIEAGRCPEQLECLGERTRVETTELHIPLNVINESDDEDDDQPARKRPKFEDLD